MLEDLEYRHDDARAFAQHPESLLTAPAEDSLDAVHAEPVDEVLRQAEGDQLRDWEPFALLTASHRQDTL